MPCIGDLHNDLRFSNTSIMYQKYSIGEKTMVYTRKENRPQLQFPYILLLTKRRKKKTDKYNTNNFYEYKRQKSE